MIDFHTHILPALDDGSRDVTESVAMMSMLAEQGIRTVVATPHFYANEHSVEHFLERRTAAYERLSAALPEGGPRLLCGAEVCYYPGISRLDGLQRLCVENSEALLLELPMSVWTEYVVKELVELSGRSHMRFVIAHMDRYMHYQSRETLERLYGCGIKMQFNARYFLEFATKRKAISMLRDGEIHFVGSDCHGLTVRPPLIGEAYRVIAKKLGDDFVARLMHMGYSLLGL